MMKRIVFLTLTSLFLASASQVFAQTGSLRIGAGNVASEPAAVLELESSTQGFLIPRVDRTVDVTAPVQGLVVFQLQEPRGFHYYNGSAWVAWHKPVAGTVNMSGGGSIIERGEGFSITHLGDGRDLIMMDMAYNAPPVVSIASGVIAGVPASFPNEYCAQNTAACNTVHLKFVNLDHLIDGSFEFATGNNNCNSSPGNKTSYSLSAPEWVTPPPVMAAGSNLRVRFDTPSNTHSVSIWGDWNQNGFFEVSERVYSEATGAVGGVTIRNADFTIPAGACDGITALRVTVTNSYDHNIGCEIDPASLGETEEVEIEIAGSACTYQERQTSCNVAQVLTDRFRVECSDLNGKQVNSRYHFRITDNN